MNRRKLLRTLGAGTTGLALAGCLTQEEDGDDGGDGENETETDTDEETENGTPADDGDGNETEETATEETEETELSGTLRIATYTSMIDSDEPAGPWLEDAFTEAHPEVEIDWITPEDGVNNYVRRAQQGADVDADMYLGVNVDDLVRVDDNLDDATLFQSIDRDRIERADRIRPGLEIDDPDERVVPYDTGYICLVYDESEVDEPETFEDLTAPEYEGTLLAQNAQTSDPGQAFMLWTLAEYGEDGYIDYWRDLLDNDVRILEDWDTAYNGAYAEGERPMVVSYSTDQVYANRFDQDMTRHQIAFPDDQGYANVETMALFEDAENEDLAYAFMDFVLSNDAQAEIAVRNVQFPAVEDEYVDLEESFDEYAHIPPEAVTMGYDQLRGNLDSWLEEWGREVTGR